MVLTLIGLNLPNLYLPGPRFKIVSSLYKKVTSITHSNILKVQHFLDDNNLMIFDIFVNTIKKKINHGLKNLETGLMLLVFPAP